MEIAAENAVEYLRAAGRTSSGEILVQAFSADAASLTLKVFDTGAGEKIGTDLRTASQKKLGKPDLRMNQGACFLLKQGKPPDSSVVRTERDCLDLLAVLLPAGSVPEVLWLDEENGVLAMSCAPPEAMNWRKDLDTGRVSIDAATHAGMLLAMMHSATHNDPAVAKRFGQESVPTGTSAVDALLMAVAEKHAAVAEAVAVVRSRLSAIRHCLTHGHFVPENALLVPGEEAAPEVPPDVPSKKAKIPLSHLMLLNFDVASFSHCAVDLAALVSHLLLMGFLHHKKWRPFMLLADNFWQTYRHTALPDLVRPADAVAGHLVGALLLTHAESPEMDDTLKEQIRRAALAVLAQKDGSIEQSLDAVSLHFEEPD